MGHPQIETPNLDELAREGIKRAACNSTCRPSLMTLITGLYNTKIAQQGMIQPLHQQIKLIKNEQESTHANF